MNFLLKDQYPVETQEQVKIAADYVEKHLTRFEPGDRAVMASRLEKRADALGVDLDRDWIHNYGRFSKTAAISPDFALHMDARKAACIGTEITTTDGVKMAAADVIDLLKTAADTALPMDLVVLVSEFDKVAELDQHYDRAVADPVFTVFGSANNPRFDAVKLADGVTDLDLKRCMRNPEFRTKLASVLKTELVEKLASTPIHGFVQAEDTIRQVIAKHVREAC